MDLAVLKFRSSGNYKLAELGNSNQLKGGMDLYVAGFPAPTQVITQSVFVSRRGQVTANSKKVFKNGYALLYDNDTLPGMSGGPVLDTEGKVVGVHGKGDREEASGVKTGFNSGVPIARFADLAASLGVNLGTTVARTGQSTTLIADDYFVSANQKYAQGNYQGSLADLNQSISLNPRFFNAYNDRGALKYQKLYDIQGALSDFNMAISLNPKYALAYNNRGRMKVLVKDYQGALSDFNMAISLNPKYALAYDNRGRVKVLVKDYQGAVADFNQAISLNSKLATAYAMRGIVRYEGMNDQAGGASDVRRAVKLARAQGNYELLRMSLETLRSWNIRE